MSEKRHTCIICGSKRYERHMKNVFLNSWACKTSKVASYHQSLSSFCCEHVEIKQAVEFLNVVNTISKWKYLSLHHLIQVTPANVIPELTLSQGKK